jgi:hypothetical protein
LLGRLDAVKRASQVGGASRNHVDSKSLDGGARFRLHFDVKTGDFRVEKKR